jgi:tetratricopeptide (TPR) repeat protein
VVGLVVSPNFCPGTAAQSHPDRFEEWLSATEAHQPGNIGKGGIDLATWAGDELEAAVTAARRQARALARSDVEAANRMLLRGAGLHADIAQLIPDEVVQRSPRQLKMYTVADGRWESVRYASMHWMLGRSLLEAITPSAAAHPEVLAWYRETSGDLLRLRSHAEAVPHLARARQLFPADTEVLFYSGFLHERFASSLLQAGAESLLEANREGASVSSRRSELTRAERFFRSALVNDPQHLETRVRRGNVLGGLGQHDAAVLELRRAIEDGASARAELRYLAHLLLGRESEAVGDYAAARAELARAAELYPNAQTPRLALSYIARRTGNRAAAQGELQALAKLPRHETRRPDPWWTYFDLR